MSGKPNPFAYKPGSENTRCFNKPLFSREQTQGAINLASVKYQYTPDNQCGPKIPCCTTKQKQDPEPRNQELLRHPSPISWDMDTQLSFIRPKGNEAGYKEGPTKEAFSGIIFCNEPGENLKMLVINSQQAFNQMRYLMYSVDYKGTGTLAPDRILSLEALMDKGEVSSIQNCHYFTIHAPSLTKQNGKMAHHDQRVWTEPVNAMAQVFSCSGHIK